MFSELLKLITNIVVYVRMLEVEVRISLKYDLKKLKLEQQKWAQGSVSRFKFWTLKLLIKLRLYFSACLKF